MLALDEISFIGLVLEGFSYGLYSGIFVMYLQIQASKKDSNKMQNVIFYSICTLYVLSIAVFVCDMASVVYALLGKPKDLLLHLLFIQIISFGCCDFIAQFILIYRCWIVWGCNFHVVVIPSILAFVFLGTWLTNAGSVYILLNQILAPRWADPIGLTSLSLSLTVNALVTGLIVFRIFKVFRDVRATAEDHILRATGGNKLRRAILVLIESGMTLFSIQFAWLVVNIVGTEIGAYLILSSIYNILTGITPTIILVRTSMGLSFHDEKSMEEVAIGSLRFASNHLNSIPEMGSISMVDQDSRGDDIIEIRPSDDFEVVNR